jgi:hypothetical protein
MVFFSKHAISLLAGCLILSFEPSTVSAVSECEDDVVQVRQIGGTNYNDSPITVLSQNSNEITFELSQEWLSDSLDHLFVRFKDTDFGSPTCLDFQDTSSTWKSDSLKAVCTKNSKLALIEVWAADTQFTSALDTATLPDCGCDAPDSLPAMVKYMFTVECVSTCTDTSCPTVITPAVIDEEECTYTDSLNAVCLSNAIHAGDTITFASGEDTRVVGDIGVSPGTSITGRHLIKPGGMTQWAAAAASFKTAMWGAGGSYSVASAIQSGERYTTGIMEIGGGNTFYPGTYRAETAINFAYGAPVTLDGLNQDNPVFLFQAGTTLTTGADTYFILKNGAKAKNIIWALGTSATLGARSIVEGSILAEASITFGTMSEIRGCAIAGAAVTFESRGYVNVKKQEESAACSRGANGACENFALHARDTITFAGAADSVITNGDVGVAPGTSITGNHAIVNGQTQTTSGSSDFATAVMFNHADLRSRREDETYWGIGIYEIGGKTFTPGTYRVGEAINFATGADVTLDGGGDEDAVFLFQAGSTLTTAANKKFILQNGAKAENIIWALGTGATLGANSVVEGSILAGSAITVGIGATVNGCAIAMTAVSFETEGFVTVPLV